MIRHSWRLQQPADPAHTAIIPVDIRRTMVGPGASNGHISGSKTARSRLEIGKGESESEAGRAGGWRYIGRAKGT